jgi:hypothetical protein
MGTDNFDIWTLWNRTAALVLKDGQPIWDNRAIVYIMPGAEISDGELIDTIQCELGRYSEEYSFKRDCFINILYFAVTRAQVCIEILGLSQGHIVVSFDELKELTKAIDQLSAIYAYKSKIISLEQFAQEMKTQTVYFSTPLGDDEQGNRKLFLCSSQGSKTSFFPVFLTEEHMRTFFSQQKRSGYMILSDTLQHFLSTLDANKMLQELGVVIEPLNACNAAIPPLLRIK